MVPTRSLALEIMKTADRSSTYDAAFITLSVSLGIPLLTTDTKIINAQHEDCQIISLA